MRNIEIKLNIDKFDEIVDALRNMKADYEGELKQVDTYYNFKEGRLKTREINNRNFELIFYKRPNVKKSEISRYFMVSVKKFLLPSIKIILRVLFGKKNVVEKDRDLWVYRNTRIHLDSVKNLGKFLELETVIKGTIEEAKREHAWIKETLNLYRYEECDGSYSDMLLGKA